MIRRELIHLIPKLPLLFLPNALPKTDRPPLLKSPDNPASEYFWHEKVVVTVFWIGENASPDNAHIDNLSTAWTTDAVSAFGGIDHPDLRNPDNPYHPQGFTPLENPFYFALPAAEYDQNGLIHGARDLSPWRHELVPEGGSLFKNRWIQIIHLNPEGRYYVCYAQWEDVGPNQEKQYAYVFGQEPVSNDLGLKAGLDISPACAIALNLDPYQPISHSTGLISWSFIDPHQVPPSGPWSQIITTSGPNWE